MEAKDVGATEDVCWKMGEQWVLVTARSPREMRHARLMATYHPRIGTTRFQYVVAGPPKGVRVLR